MKKLVFCLLFLTTTAFARSYPAVQKLLQDIVTQHPTTAKLENIGISDSKNQIQGVALGNGEIQTLVVATHHGNEYGGTEVAKALALSLADQPIKGQTVHIIPVLNILGYTNNARTERDSTNVSRDPNRDYPGPCDTEGPFKLKSTAALAKFIKDHQIVTAATLHTYTPAVVYPWGISSHDLDTGYNDIFKGLVQAATVESGYQTGNSTEVIYPADGTFEDYAFWKQGIWSILFELGYSHNPGDAELQELIKVNVPGIRRMLEQAPTQVADKHDFTGKCDARLQGLDRHDE
jgi:carboxypeptidase T